MESRRGEGVTQIGEFRVRVRVKKTLISHMLHMLRAQPHDPQELHPLRSSIG